MSSKITRDDVDDKDQVISETPVAARSARFALQFLEVNDDLIALVSACSDEDWRRICPGEGWSVGVVAHHVASVLPAFHSFVQKLASGDALVPRVSLDVVNERNAQHAQDFAGVDRADVLDLLTTHGPRIVQLIQTLNEEQLELTTSAFGGQERSLAQLVERVVIGHSRMHLASMRAALGE